MNDEDKDTLKAITYITIWRIVTITGAITIGSLIGQWLFG